MVRMDIGPSVEEVYGSGRYFFLYVAMGAASFVVSSLDGHLSLGASGAILGLVGLMIAITTRRGVAYMRELRSRLISWVVTIFAVGLLFTGMHTDNWAHADGLADGFLLGTMFTDRQ